jgi:hypothetical protein
VRIYDAHPHLRRSKSWYYAIEFLILPQSYRKMIKFISVIVVVVILITDPVMYEFDAPNAISIDNSLDCIINLFRRWSIL